MRIAIVAALPGELKALVRGWSAAKPLPAPTPKGVALWHKQHGPDEFVAVCAGMGAAAARRAFAAAEFGGALDMVLSVGWAGGLDAVDNRAVHIASEVIDAQTGERFRLTDAPRILRLVTTATVADAAEKRRLHASYGAALVDMEAAAIARLAQIRGIPIGCFKAVSDGPQAMLPDLNLFLDAAGQLRLPRFLGYVALRPRFWASLVRLGRQSAQTATALAAAIERFLIDKDLERVNRTGEV